MNKVGIGIIGCGNISSAYLKAMASFPSRHSRTGGYERGGCKGAGR